MFGAFGFGSRGGDANMPDVGQYKLGHTLGKGTFGEVKLATHIPTGDKVAVKIISAANAYTNRHMLQQEIENQQRLHHRHVVKIYDVIEKDGDTYIVMELVTGGDLFDFIVRHVRLPEEKARLVFQQIIAGAEHCHENNVAHRDLKPENIFLDSNGNVKIGDFGLSGQMIPDKLLTESCGSPNYAAPELFRKGCAYKGPEVDVWSCGVILYALLCNKLPFDDQRMEELIRKVKRGSYSTPGYVSTEAQDLISKMICVDPEQRISIAEIREHPWFLQDLPPELSHASEVPEAPKFDSQDVDVPALQEAPQLDSQVITDSETNGAKSSSRTKVGGGKYDRASAVSIASSLLTLVASNLCSSHIALTFSPTPDGVWSKLVRNQSSHQCASQSLLSQASSLVLSAHDLIPA